MNGSSLEYAEAVVIDQDKIVFVGTRAEANKIIPSPSTVFLMAEL